MLSEGLETLRAALLFYLPEIDAVIFIAPRQQFSVSAESHRPEPVVKTSTWQGFETVPAVHLPFRYLLVVATTDQGFSIDAEDEGSYGADPAAQGRETLSTVLSPHLPQLDLTIIITTGQQAAIGTEGHRPDHSRVSVEGPEAVPTALCSRLPHLPQ